MNNARLAEAEKGLNGIAAKVLEATPKQEPWPLSKIIGELKRTGTSASVDVVLGCLSTMLKAGLVREPEPRHFIRVMPKQRAEPVEVAAVVATEPAQAVESEPDTLEKLADLSAKVRATARLFEGLALCIDDVAIEVEERIAAINDDSAKLAQLRALLKGIG